MEKAYVVYICGRKHWRELGTIDKRNCRKMWGLYRQTDMGTDSAHSDITHLGYFQL